MEHDAFCLINKNFLCITEEYSINKLKLLNNNQNIILLKNDETYIGFISNSNSYLLNLIETHKDIKIKDIISKSFIVTKMEDNLINIINNIIDVKVELIIIVNNKNTVIGVINYSDVIKYLKKINSKIIINNNKTRHDLRGSIFTLNTSISILEKNPKKFEQIIIILKKATISLGHLVELWKANDAASNINIDHT